MVPFAPGALCLGGGKAPKHSGPDFLVGVSTHKTNRPRGAGPRQKPTERGGSEGQKAGLRRESNPGPLAPEARIIPLDHEARSSMPVRRTSCYRTWPPPPSGRRACAPPRRRRAGRSSHRAGLPCHRTACPRCWCARHSAAPPALRLPCKKHVGTKNSVSELLLQSWGSTPAPRLTPRL